MTSRVWRLGRCANLPKWTCTDTVGLTGTALSRSLSLLPSQHRTSENDSQNPPKHCRRPRSKGQTTLQNRVNLATPDQTHPQAETGYKRRTPTTNQDLARSPYRLEQRTADFRSPRTIKIERHPDQLFSSTVQDLGLGVPPQRRAKGTRAKYSTNQAYHRSYHLYVAQQAYHRCCPLSAWTTLMRRIAHAKPRPERRR
jgi:hypothetical protein